MKSQKKSEDIEKFYSVFVNDKRDGFLICQEHFSSFIFLFNGEDTECKRIK